MQLPKTFIIISTMVFVILGICVGSIMAMDFNLNLANPISKLNTLHQIHSTKTKSLNHYLIVGVNTNSSKRDSSLESIWILSFNSDYNQLNLQGLPAASVILNQFNQSPNTFSSYIETLTDKTFSASFTLTEKQFIWIINEVGGLNLYNEQIDGSKAYKYIQTTRDTNAKTKRQAEVLLALITQLEKLGKQFDISHYTKHLQPKVYSLIDINRIVANIFPIQSSQININTYTISD